MNQTKIERRYVDQRGENAEPKFIGLVVWGETGRRERQHLVVAVATLPRVGETVLYFPRGDNTGMRVFEVIDVSHWAVGVPPGTTDLEGSEFVDAVFEVAERGLDFHNDRLKERAARARRAA